MNFTDARQSDVSELVALINAAYRSPGSTPGWTDERHLMEGPRIDAEMAAEDWASNRFIVLRLTRSGPIKGDDASWYLASIAVSTAQQSRGLGAALLREIERQAKRANIAPSPWYSGF